MAISITSTPVDNPAGLRFTFGVLDFNGATYSAGGIAVTAAQWGGGSNGIPSRQPDFVIFDTGTAADDDALTSGTVWRWNKGTGKVLQYGSEPLNDEKGLGEDDAANTASASYLAVWITPSPAGFTTA